LALFFVCGISPILDFFEQRLQAPRTVAVVITFVLGVVLASLLWSMIWLSVASLINDADTYRDRLNELVSTAAATLGLQETESSDAAVPARSAKADEQQADELAEYVGGLFRRGLGQLSTALMELLSSAMMVLIFMFFLLLGGSASAVPRRGVWLQIESQVRSYIVAKTAISLVTGALFGFVLWLFGVPLAFVFGVLAFLLNFIPNIGPVIASLLPLPLIVLSPELSVTSMIVVTGSAVAIQFISGNIVEPKIMGESFELHPVAILLTLMLWGMIWGIVGMFLAVPMTAAVKILLDKFAPTKPVAELLAGHLGALKTGDNAPTSAAV
jgi:AI-2 transport protein TqsA